MRVNSILKHFKHILFFKKKTRIQFYSVGNWDRTDRVSSIHFQDKTVGSDQKTNKPTRDSSSLSTSVDNKWLLKHIPMCCEAVSLPENVKKNQSSSKLERTFRPTAKKNIPIV